jgi:hypothetical protein
VTCTYGWGRCSVVYTRELIRGLVIILWLTVVSLGVFFGFHAES